MAAQGVLYEIDQKVGIVTLNRPDKLNALSMELRLELERMLRSADDDPATSVIVLRSQGRSFCVGFDIGGDGEGGEHHLARFGDLARRVGPSGAFGEERLGRGAVEVVDGELVAGLLQIGRHALAHHAEPDKTDAHLDPPTLAANTRGSGVWPGG